ncbi:MAG: PilZ domain-containing protein [Polyangiaceae bacterium]|nr:PilZ domain-containing protein [Polyangiaceae bacterium]
MMWLQDARDRQSVRREVRAECQAVADEGFRLLGIRTLDLSEEGMLLHSSADVALGETVYVSVKAPNTLEWIDSEAVVVRLVRGRRDTDGRCGIGLRFIGMDAVDRAILSGSLRDVPPPVPARNARKDYARAVREIGAGRG